VPGDAARTFSLHARIKPNRIYDPHKYRHDVRSALEIAAEASRGTTYRPAPVFAKGHRRSLQVVQIITENGGSLPCGNYFNGAQCDDNLLLNRVRLKRLRVDRVHA